MKTKALKKQNKSVAKAPKKKMAKKSIQKAATAPAPKKVLATKAKKKQTPHKKQTPRGKQTDIHKFPGYPHYPAGEDITRNSKRVDADIEDLSLSKTVTPKVKISVTKLKRKTADELVDESLKNSSSNLTKEDYEALGPKDLSLDMGDDEELKHRTSPVDFSGKDMDVPGSELDDDREADGAEDEENNSYSLGGDNHQDLEEDRS